MSAQYDLRTALQRLDLSTSLKEDLLPTPIHGMYLHVNSDTSALEWISAGQISAGKEADVAWGKMRGDLSSQLDLASVLDVLSVDLSVETARSVSVDEEISSGLCALGVALSCEIVRSVSVDNEISDVISSVILPQLSNKIDSVFILSNYIDSLDGAFTEAGFTSASNGKTAVAHGTDLLSGVFPDAEGQFILRQGNSEDERELQFVFTSLNKSNKIVKKISGVWGEWRNDSLEVSVNNVKQSEEYSFYAPLSSGQLRQLLQSNGAGKAPSWIDNDIIPGVIQLNGGPQDVPDELPTISSIGSFGEILVSRGLSVHPEWKDTGEVTDVYLNGSPGPALCANIYVPLSADLSGRILMSNGAGKQPTWTGTNYIRYWAFLNGSQQPAVSAQVHAPLSGGLSGNVLQSCGEHLAPEWKNAADLLFDVLCPVGTIYSSINSTLPEAFTKSGRTWEEISSGTFLMAADALSVGSTGGTNQKTLDVANLPSHAHSFTGKQVNFDNCAGHTHRGEKLQAYGQIYCTAGKTGEYAATGNLFAASYYWLKEAISGSAAERYKIQVSFANKWSGNTTSTGGHNHSYTAKGNISNVGSGTGFDKRPEFVAVRMWIRRS